MVLFKWPANQLMVVSFHSICYLYWCSFLIQVFSSFLWNSGVWEEGKARNGNQWYIHIKIKRIPGASCQNCEVTGVKSFLIFSQCYSSYLRCLMLHLTTVIYNGAIFTTWNAQRSPLMDKGVVIICSGVAADRGGKRSSTSLPRGWNWIRTGLCPRTRWSWITEPPLVWQAPSWVCMMNQPHMWPYLNLAIWNEVCKSNRGSVI